MKKIGIGLGLLFSNIAFCTTVNETNFMTELPEARISYHRESSGTVWDSKWLARHGRMFLALAGDLRNDGSGIVRVGRIYEFNPYNQTMHKELLSDISAGGTGLIYSMSWLTEGPVNYLAVGTEDTPTKVHVYRFNPNVGELSEAGATAEGEGPNTVYALDWLVAQDQDGNTHRYLAVGGDAGDDTNKLFLFRWNPVEVFEAAFQALLGGDGDISALAWKVLGQRIFLAIGRGTGANEIQVAELDTQTHQLTILPAANVSLIPPIESLDWITIGGKTYLAAGGTNSSEVLLYEFLPDANPALVPLQTIDIPGITEVNDVKWINIQGQAYLGVATNANPNVPAMYVYKFTPGATDPLSVIFSSVFGVTTDDVGNDAEEFAWLQYGPLVYAAVSGEEDNNDEEESTIAVRIFRVNFNQDIINSVVRSKYFQNFPHNAPDVSQRA